MSNVSLHQMNSATGADERPMAHLPKISLSYLLSDVRLGKYGDMCCISDVMIRGVLDTYLERFGVHATARLLAAACCPTPCAQAAPPLPPPNQRT